MSKRQMKEAMATQPATSDPFKAVKDSSHLKQGCFSRISFATESLSSAEGEADS